MTGVLIIGYGSIGQRHARLFGELGCTVAVVSRRAIEHAPCYGSITKALAAFTTDVVVITSATHEHARDLRILAEQGFAGKLLVEKPLTRTREYLPSFDHAAVAYNLRFHPLMQALSAALRARKLLAFDARIGQYLPDWRPGTDYRDSYSAHGDQGGGVLCDLSHELDYTAWLCGPWTRLTALGGQLSHLEITSEDVVSILMETKACPTVSIHLNYLQDVVQRQVVAVTDDGTVVADFIADTLTDKNGTQRFSCGRDDTYLAQNKAVINDDFAALCSLEEGLAVVDTIDAARHALSHKKWITAP